MNKQQQNSFRFQMIEFFNRHAEKYSAVDLMKMSPARSYEFSKIYEFAQLPKSADIIELGCGVGKYVLPLLNLGYHVTAVDISTKSLAVLRKQASKHKLSEHLQIIHSDFSKEKIYHKYDVAFCISTYHLLGETKKIREQIFANLVRSVKIGGTVIVIEPNPYNPIFYPFYLFDKRVAWNIEHNFIYSSQNYLKGLFIQNNLSNIKIQFVGFLPLRLINIHKMFAAVNQIINYLPIINNFSSFIYIKGKNTEE